jgi:hypothetical protein
MPARQTDHFIVISTLTFAPFAEKTKVLVFAPLVLTIWPLQLEENEDWLRGQYT